MAKVRVYRKATGFPPPKVSREAIDRFRAECEAGKIRIRRPALEKLFIPERAGSIAPFYRMEALPPAVIRNRPVRMMEHSRSGFTVPDGDLGRWAGYEPEKSTVDSINIWLAKNLANFVRPEDVSIVLE